VSNKIGESLVNTDGSQTKVPVLFEGERGGERIEWKRVPRGTMLRRGQEIVVNGKSGARKATRWV
jgi:hypothetical protein